MFEPPVARAPSTEERDAWIQAASHRNPPRTGDVKKLQAWLKARGSWRYALLAQLIRWAEREYLNHLGIYPEDARWLLP